MRGIGTLHPTDGVEIQPDTTITFILAAGTAQAIDYPSNAQLMTLTGSSTANVALSFFVNQNSSGAAVPSSGLSTSTTGINQLVLGIRDFQITGGATGFSVVAQTSGYVVAEFWKKGG